ncbi:Vacuolar protein sorting-associated protein 20 [Monosporozyma unispora]|nr:Vacuolar protein sorting-associated protein 20 [Kazachstania unispora]
MLVNIEFKLIESQFLTGLKKGNDILTKLNKEFTNIDEVISDAQEQMAYQNEINDALANSVVGVNNFEDEIDKELDNLGHEINPPSKLDMPTTEGLPAFEYDKEANITKPDIVAEKQKEERIQLPS